MFGSHLNARLPPAPPSPSTSGVTRQPTVQSARLSDCFVAPADCVDSSHDSCTVRRICPAEGKSLERDVSWNFEPDVNRSMATLEVGLIEAGAGSGCTISSTVELHRLNYPMAQKSFFVRSKHFRSLGLRVRG